jgi:thiosulfate/3-mercaptopyruvate sulfurtransferase
LNPDATVRDLAFITAQLDQKGLSPKRETICYCTGGVRSAWLYFVLRIAGYEHVRNYPGSWWEWSRDFGCPAERDLASLQKLLGMEQASVPKGTRPS